LSMLFCRCYFVDVILSMLFCRCYFVDVILSMLFAASDTYKFDKMWLRLLMCSTIYQFAILVFDNSEFGKSGFESKRPLGYLLG
jgi:hypothetical protein